ncbi:TIGR04211 family SH3 domain-containing protein [Shewanella sp. AS1]|uniref:TIGR04211 family SH3 domain-containing protein n=1 Tax=Shewanella sp. AS1 TaxID=2907626 RepID=UPI001F371D65|nr:TIGR04211 family SH3 domain-containing protein [Shewanella sp. AS1]MCE9677658.1 TIGR04211 family SH3 domain-containing protein [Shewanella sp. AS1]
MLRLLSTLAMMSLSFNLLAAEPNRYISDNVFTYVLGGPSTQYRIVGSVEAGQPVTFLGETQGDYSKIVDHKGREGWVQTEMLSNTKSFRIQLPEVEAKLESIQSKYADLKNQSSDGQQLISQLKSQLANAEKQLASVTSERNKATSELAKLRNDDRYELLKQGGMIAGAGLLIGVIIAYLPRPRRRQKNRW